ncbi:MAG: N-acetyltransferase [Xanthomonadales bacterium]|nr:N-acetyltransferase [Xanthomonadales bacterium]
MTAAEKPSRHANPDVASLRWNETLANGTNLLIRAISKDDVELERTFINGMSPESRHMRFLAQISAPSDELLKRLTDLDFDREMALVATIDQHGTEVEIGVSRYATADDREVGECAVTVADDWQHRGVGTLLMRRLIEVARARGIKKLYSLDDPENVKMQELAEELGFTRHFDPQNPHEVTHSFDLS